MVVKSFTGETDQGPIARDLNCSRGTERVAACFGAGDDDHLSQLHALLQAKLAVEGTLTST